MRRAAVLLALVCASAAGCSGDEEPYVIRVVSGIGQPAFDAAVTRVELRVRDGNGVERAVSEVPVGAGSLEVPDAAKSGIGSLALAGLGGEGALLSYGRTPSLELSGLSGQPTLRLAIFVQRTSSIVPAWKLAGKLTTPRCATMGARYALIADGTTADVVDLLDVSVTREQAFVTAPVSIATAGALVLTIDAEGKASLVNLSTGVRTTPTAPTGATFADVAFGATVIDESGGAWIVGPTRGNAPSDVAIRLGSDGALVARKLLRPRKSAAATWVNGRGLLVAYGDDMLGVELLAPSATASTPLPYPVDARAGGVLVPLDGGKVLRVDADGAATALDLTCASGCAPVAASFKDEPRAARADDHASMLEGGGAIVVRGGRVLRLPPDASKLELLHDAGASPVCTTPLSTGIVAVAIGGDDVVRTIAPAR